MEKKNQEKAEAIGSKINVNIGNEREKSEKSEARGSLSDWFKGGVCFASSEDVMFRRLEDFGRTT
jgi:hypothetical protein